MTTGQVARVKPRLEWPLLLLIATMIVLSLFLTLALNLVAAALRR